MEPCQSASDGVRVAVKHLGDRFGAPSLFWHAVQEKQHLQLLDGVDALEEKSAHLLRNARRHGLPIKNVRGPV